MGFIATCVYICEYERIENNQTQFEYKLYISSRLSIPVKLNKRNTPPFNMLC